MNNLLADWPPQPKVPLRQFQPLLCRLQLTNSVAFSWAPMTTMSMPNLKLIPC